MEEMEEMEMFDPSDPDMVPVTIEDIDLCLKVFNANFKEHTGRKIPKWRSSPPTKINELREMPSLRASVPIGQLFYPCSGTDVEAAIGFFSGYVSEFHFADPFHPASPKLRRGKRLEKTDVIHFSLLGDLLNAQGFSQRLDRSDVVAVSHKKDGVLTLLDDISDLSVFYYRGDSPGEGGSNQWWMGPVLFDLVLSKILDGGLVCGDGSNGCGHFFVKLLDEPVGASFVYRNLTLTRLNAYMPGKLRPMFVWQVHVG